MPPLQDQDLEKLIAEWRESLPQRSHVDLLQFAKFIADAQYRVTHREELNLRIDECEEARFAMNAAYPNTTILIDSFFVKLIGDYRAELRAKEQ